MKTIINNVNSFNSLENPLNDYSKYIENLEDHNWRREKITINENLSMLVTINNLKANTEGIVIDLVCYNIKISV